MRNAQVTEKGHLGQDGVSEEGNGEKGTDMRDGELGDKLSKRIHR